MKKYDWEHSAEHHSPCVHQWLKENYKKPITEEEYVNALQSMRHERIKGGKRNPARDRKSYRGLKKSFGFFI